MRFIYSILIASVFLIGVVGFQKAVANSQEAPRISLADAKKDFDTGTAVFVDSRPAESYKDLHIKGAINVPLSDAETRWKEIPTDKKIIVYCS